VEEVRLREGWDGKEEEGGEERQNVGGGDG